ncbi:MAG: hypothetical protein EAZ95_14625 [Bacteroidetes bacterium]|nr:MAG: hypothetical protein EAZ95_14625 [Bacteroidota bacterium]
MKLLPFLFLLFYSLNAQAQCQLCYLSEAQARQVVSYLNNDSEVVLYYSNCTQESKDVARRIKIKKAMYKKTDRPDMYEITLEGTVIGTFDVLGRKLENYVKNDMPFSEPIDITFVHVRAGGAMSQDGIQSWEAVSLGIYLGFDCDPCIDPFQYPNQQME